MAWQRCRSLESCGGGTRRSEETGLSRTTIYKHAQRIEQTVMHEAAGGVRYAILWAENQRLRAENEARWAAWAEVDTVPEAKQRAFAATGAALGLTLGQIVT